MPTFALDTLEQVKGKQIFYKLIVDGECPFDEFVDGLEKQYESEMDGIFNWMNRVANNNSVPKEKFHPYDDGKKGIREYEFKSKHLRVYAIEYPNGKIIISGGTKTTQQKDAQYFRKLKDQYEEYENKRRTLKK